MIIRKSFKIGNSHIVRNCSSQRCKKNLHGHTYEVEVFLESNKLDNGMMVLDFGLTKTTIKDFIYSFKDAYSIWNRESEDFKNGIKQITDRWVDLPASPSAEAYSLMFLYVIDQIVKNTEFNNGEGNLKVHSVRVHETTTGYAESFQSDLESEEMPKFKLTDFVFGEGVKREWSNPDFWDMLLKGEKFVNPIVEQQV